MSSLLQGKVGLILGVANNMSIAWGIAEACKEQGAELIFTYQNATLQKRVEPLAASLGSKLVLECEVTSEESLSSLFQEIKNTYGKLDFIVHCIAFADKNELRGRSIDTTLGNFLNAMHISVYSLLSVIRHAEVVLSDNASILTLTYYGAEKVMPNYNVMGICKAALESAVRYAAYDMGGRGIRVNAISAGAIKTLAASAIGGFSSILKANNSITPLKRNINQQDLAGAALFCLSDLSSGMTAEVMHVDAGFHAMGMMHNEEST